MVKKREKLEVIRDILQVIKDRSGKIRPTHILYKSNLSYPMMNEYIANLIKNGFVAKKEIDGKRTYSITSKGLEYLDKFKFVKEFTDAFGLD